MIILEKVDIPLKPLFYLSFIMRQTLLSCCFLLFNTCLFGQTLIINEVSNGPLGIKEYIELVAVDTGASFNCGNTTPPCIDIRNWIIDDNSGYHSIGTVGTGVAPGCNRFSNDALWSCVPLGTIIVVYNNTDPNADLPPDDLSLTDGNCTIIAPIDNTTLFERNPTTPGAAACSYPATGWVAGGQWSNIGMANGGDCARIVDLAGCEVFSVCWGNCDQNNLIYFAGSGTDDVWFFNDVDPLLQVNWTEGCADPGTCGSNQQTPGVPNNAANAQYLLQYNNGCAPITPMLANAFPNNASCPCGGIGVATGSGSIPPYTYEWFDSGFTPLGVNNDSLTGACDGTYYVIISSQSTGCSDTAAIAILNGTAGSNAGTDSTFTICSSIGSIDLINYLGGTPDAGGTWSGPSGLTGGDLGTLDPNTNTSGQYDYLISGGGACPDSLASIFITIEPQPDAGLDASIAFCSSEPSLALFGQLGGSPQQNGTWIGPSPLTGGHLGNFDPSSAMGGVYAYVVGGTICQSDTAFMTVTLTTQANVNLTVNYPPFCEADLPFFIDPNQTGGNWTASCATCIDGATGLFNPDSAGVGMHQVIYTVPGSCGDSDSLMLEIIDLPAVLVAPDTLERCPNDTATFWAFGENIEWFDGAMDTAYVFQDSGTFYVTANNLCGSDTGYVHIIWTDGTNCGTSEEPWSWMLFPNIFTPNGDGENDVFQIMEYWNISDLHVSIYNRWGQLQYEWDGIDGYWTGVNLKGIVVTEGTYFFVATAKDYKGGNYVIKSPVTLIR